jgi:energy-coupling factor transporter ATP-binding protein EcfA2
MPLLEERAVDISNLESEIINFAGNLPLWSKFLASKILNRDLVSDEDINLAYDYLLEEYELKETTNIETKIDISKINLAEDLAQTKLTLLKLQNIEGVNALVENQILEFSPQVTLIYGANGSGKTGYVRFLKKAFFSRKEEEVLPNVYSQEERKPIQGEFVFKKEEADHKLNYPKDSSSGEFRQFSVFDNKCAPVHLNEKNEFEFKPEGLSFFSRLVELYKQVEGKLDDAIKQKSINTNYSSIFNGESSIKSFIKSFIDSISSETKITDLEGLAKYNETEKLLKAQLEQKKAELMALKKDKEIKDLTEIKNHLLSLISKIDTINNQLSKENLQEINKKISDHKTKKEQSKSSTLNDLTNNKLKSIGSDEWKEFIIAADRFKEMQHDQYPCEDDVCIYCHQGLPVENQKLISSYDKFLKSASEQELNDIKSTIDQIKKQYQDLDFNIILEENILYKWLNENYNEEVEKITKYLSGQKILALSIVDNVDKEKTVDYKISQFDVASIQTIVENVDKNITELENQQLQQEIQRITSQITELEHKEKLTQHLVGIKTYVENQKWLNLAQRAKQNEFKTIRITNKEKDLSKKYFSADFLLNFKEICKELDGDFNLGIDQTGSSGISFRKYNIEGHKPSEILSESEQKVIALADFITESRLSSKNMGILFDDPVTSLDEKRKIKIAQKLVSESQNKQVIVFTHDLTFVYALIESCKDNAYQYLCHWIEQGENGSPGHIALNNAPCYEKEYRNDSKPMEHYSASLSVQPAERENVIKQGFSALRTCYEVLVIDRLFKNTIQRWNERVSMEAFSKVNFEKALRDEIVNGFTECCKYMEGHTHSDKKSALKPTKENLKEEIDRYNEIRNKIK